MLNRRELLQRAAVAAPAVMLSQAALASAQTGGGAPFGGRNLVIFMTDQERAIQHFPQGWAERNLPNYQRLVRHGVSFDNAVCNACMCSPSRATFFSGQMPAHHGVKYTLEEDMPNDQYPQVPLSPDFPNLATAMSAVGYDVVYKGKFHICKPANGSTFQTSDLLPYGFTRWNPPDAGANQDIDQAGGGSIDNDGRYIDSEGDPETGQEGVLQFLGTRKPGDKPFCLVISLVNPHDVLLYPRNYEKSGYDDSWLDGQVGLPETVHENLSTKPAVQKAFIKLMALTGTVGSSKRKRNYMRFYANLMKSSDTYLGQVLDALDRQGLTNDTVVVRTADHGEMGMAHGGMRQKNFQAYEETMRVPLVFSNPQLFPRARRSNALVSHVDFMPTVAGLFGAPKQAVWQGQDYAHLVTGTSSRPVQDHTVFTFEDVQGGQAGPPYLKPPNCIVAVREQRYKIVETYDAKGQLESQWEFYDRKLDPLERRNLAWPGVERTPEQDRAYERLQAKLKVIKRRDLQPMPYTPQPLVQPSN